MAGHKGTTCCKIIAFYLNYHLVEECKKKKKKKKDKTKTYLLIFE